MRKGRLDRQAGSKGRGLIWGLRSLGLSALRAIKGAQCDTMKPTFGEISLAAMRRTPCRRE